MVQQLKWARLLFRLLWGIALIITLSSFLLVYSTTALTGLNILDGRFNSDDFLEKEWFNMVGLSFPMSGSV